MLGSLPTESKARLAYALRHQRSSLVRSMVTSGLISYSIYLYHLAFIVKLSDLGWLHDLGWVAVAGVAFVCSVVEAAISYRLIEAPGIALGRRWAKAASARIARRRLST